MRKPSTYMSEEYLKEYWKPFSQTFSKEKTRNDYFTNLCNLCDYIKKDIPEAVDEDIDCYVRHLLEKVRTGKLKQGTVNVKVSVLHAAYNDLIERGGYENANPVHKDMLPQMSEYINPDKIPTEAEMDTILTAAREDRMMYAIISMIIRCAFTPGEIISIKTEDIIMDKNQQAAVTFHYRKETRYVKVPQDVLAIINSYLAYRTVKSEYLFCNQKGNALRLRDLERRYQKCIYPGREVQYTLQALRNGAITIMLKSGAPGLEVAKYVGIDFNWIKRYNLAAEILSQTAVDYANIRIINPF